MFFWKFSCFVVLFIVLSGSWVSADTLEVNLESSPQIAVPGSLLPALMEQDLVDYYAAKSAVESCRKFQCGDDPCTSVISFRIAPVVEFDIPLPQAERLEGELGLLANLAVSVAIASGAMDSPSSDEQDLYFEQLICTSKNRAPKRQCQPNSLGKRSFESDENDAEVQDDGPRRSSKRRIKREVQKMPTVDSYLEFVNKHESKERIESIQKVHKKTVYERDVMLPSYHHVLEIYKNRKTSSDQKIWADSVLRYYDHLLRERFHDWGSQFWTNDYQVLFFPVIAREYELIVQMNRSELFARLDSELQDQWVYIHNNTIDYGRKWVRLALSYDPKAESKKRIYDQLLSMCMKMAQFAADYPHHFIEVLEFKSDLQMIELDLRSERACESSDSEFFKEKRLRKFIRRPYDFLILQLILFSEEIRLESWGVAGISGKALDRMKDEFDHYVFHETETWRERLRQQLKEVPGIEGHTDA